jgi:glycosyltransferase XagB
MALPQLRRLLRQRILTLEVFGEPQACVVCGRHAFEAARQAGFNIAARIPLSEFHFLIRSIWGGALQRTATHGLARKAPQYSARSRFSIAQAVAGVLLVAIMAVFMSFVSLHAVILVMRFLGAVFFLSLIAVKLLALLPRTLRVYHAVTELADEDLPEYSVLVPLYREVSVLPQLLSALAELDYPSDKLDVKIVVEEYDVPMRNALRAYAMPEWLEVIVVPDGKPRTKPRALDYALQFARGGLVTIYDAEDIPDPGQLRECAAVFAQASPRLACLQASLVPANEKKNWLIRQFEIEYATLFGRIMPALAGLGLPLALGGTSNHFRADALRRIGGWDAFNVTEDADIGLRLAREGWSTSLIASHTSEEACVDYASWRRQRARWLKGFLQTWLVHMRNPAQTVRDLGWTGLWVITASTIGVFLSALLHPVLILMTAVDLMAPPISNGIGETALQSLYFAVFVLGYGVSISVSALAMGNRKMELRWLNLMSMPLYWLLMWPAAVQALWEFAVKPHHWNKTEHGKSRLVPSMPAASRTSSALLHHRQQQQDTKEEESQQNEDVGDGKRQRLPAHEAC